MAWIDSVFQRECLPVLEAGMGFAHQQGQVIANNIANVNTPEYKRQTVPEGQFYDSLVNAIDERAELHPSRFSMRESLDVRYDGTYPRMRMFDGKEAGPERHDENSVVIEKEMADLAKNTLKMQAMQQLYKKHLDKISMSLRDKV